MTENTPRHLLFYTEPVLFSCLSLSLPLSLCFSILPRRVEFPWVLLNLWVETAEFIFRRGAYGRGVGGVQIEGIDSPEAAAAAAAAADERVHNYFETMYLARIICMMTSPALSPFTLREMIGNKVHKLQL